MTKPRAERRGKSLGQVAYEAFYDVSIYADYPWQLQSAADKQEWNNVARRVIKAYRTKPASAGRGRGRRI